MDNGDALGDHGIYLLVLDLDMIWRAPVNCMYYKEYHFLLLGRFNTRLLIGQLFCSLGWIITSLLQQQLKLLK